ncbi:extracellular solute-binding protein, partial [bacterium]|nr:extracellular solute-binding protein [bacterium]
METKQKIIIGSIVGAIVLIVIGIVLFIFLNKKVIEQKVVTLKYWGFDEKEPIQKIADKYKEKNKNITIEYTQKGSTPEEYQKILNDALASGDGPDLFQIRNDWLPRHYKKMATMPEDTYSVDEYKDTFFSIAFTDLSRNNELYAVPYYIDTLALYFNKSTFDAKSINNPGKTWDDFQPINKSLRELSGDFVQKAGTAIGTSSNINYSEDILYMLMLQNQTTMTSPDNKTAYFNLPSKDKYSNVIYPGAAALNYYASYSSPSKENYTWNDKIEDSLTAFISGKSATYFGYAADRKKIDALSDKKLNYEVSKSPQILGSEVYIAKYWATGVSKNSEGQEESWKFLKYATEKTTLVTYAADTDLPTSRKDISENQSTRRYLDVFLEQTPKAVGWNKGNWEEVDKIFREAITSVYNNNATAQQAMDKAAQKITPIMKE